MINNTCTTLNENKFFIGSMMIILTIGGRFIINELDENQKKIMEHPIIKKIILFCAFFMATRDIQTALILTILFVIIVNCVLNDINLFKVEEGYPSSPSSSSSQKDRKEEIKNIIRDLEKLIT
tara:strand:- start:10618 stop:10986 length:369 start_codon:yes stop_codon:yes gene_type:complete